MDKCIVVMPAYNAGKTLADTYKAIPMHCVDEIILVDDGSHDNTVEIAKGLGIRVITHTKNTGYGANQKTCYTEALNCGADIVIMLHPDGQHDPSLVPELIAAVQSGKGDMVLASRFLKRGGALKGGMPHYKFIANRMLTKIENIALGTSLAEFHSGYRAYSRRLLEILPFMEYSNDFIFDQQMIFNAVRCGARIHEIPTTTRYFEDSSSIDFWSGIIYGIKVIGISSKCLLRKFKASRDPSKLIDFKKSM